MSLQILVLLENPFKDISLPNVWQGLGWALLLINGVTAAQGVAPAVSQAIARQEGTDELLSVWPLEGWPQLLCRGSSYPFVDLELLPLV